MHVLGPSQSHPYARVARLTPPSLGRESVEWTARAPTQSPDKIRLLGFTDATRLATLHNSAMPGPLTPRHKGTARWSMFSFPPAQLNEPAQAPPGGLGKNGSRKPYQCVASQWPWCSPSRVPLPSPCRATRKSRPAARLCSSPVRFLPPLSQALRKRNPGTSSRCAAPMA
jgi:hypothetical protein